MEDLSMTGAAMALAYQRGHDLSGYVRLLVDADGSATASRSERGDRHRRDGSAQLSRDQIERLRAAVDAADLIHSRGSKRLLGDGELPIHIAIDIGGRHHEVDIWAQDLDRIEAWAAVDRVVRELANDVIGSG